MNQQQVMQLIVDERARQDAKWGEQNHDDPTWYLILQEEGGEVAKAILERQQMEYLKEELVQMGAVIVAWLECFGREADQATAE